MNDICIDDRVISVGDRSVVGEVLSTSESSGGLHSSVGLDAWDTGTGPRFSDSGLAPVRWSTDYGVPYEWWEAPESLEVICPAPDRSQIAAHLDVPFHDRGYAARPFKSPVPAGADSSRRAKTD